MADRVKVPGTLQTRASFESSTFNPEAGTVEVVWTTGARGLRRGWDGAYFEELEVSDKAVDLSRLNRGASVLNAHSSWDLSSVIGVVERAWLSGAEGRALIRFSDREDVKPIRDDVKAGILRNVSVGYQVQRYEKVEESDGLPVYRATRWTPAEISLVPVPFDAGAQVRGSEAQSYEVEIETRAAAPRRESTMDEKKTETPAAPNAVEEATRAAAERREQEAAQAAVANSRATERALKAERERVIEIRSLVRSAKLGDELADRLIREDAKIEDVRKAVLEHLTRQDTEIRTEAHFSIGEDVREKFIRGATASILERTGHSETIEAAKKGRLGKHFANVSTDPGEFRGWRLYDLARHSLEMRGASTRGLHGEALVKRALEFRGDAGMNVAGDFAVLLESVVNKVFLGRYSAIPVTWPSLCARRSVNDFRATTFYRPGTFGALDTVTEAGEIKHKNIPDGAKATLTPGTKGNIIGISRRAIVNDDLGAFRDLAAGLGEAAALTVEQDAWTMITTASGLGANAPDGVALFNAAHSNIGSTGAMSVATLDSMRAKMALQKDASSNVYLAARPAILLVPVELAGTAKVFNSSAADPTDYKNSNVANRVNGLFREIIDSPYLSANSAVRVYALADPNLLPVFAVGFIDGQEAPRIDSEQSFNYDGLQMKVVLDYGTAVIDYRGAVTCAGQ